jgi:sugar phosphate isomerase/epimerase
MLHRDVVLFRRPRQRRRLRVFGGRIGDGLTRADAVEQVARCLGRLADHAGCRQVVVCVETHDDWCDPADVAAVKKRVGHPAIAVNWDIMHSVIHGLRTMDAAFETLRPWIRHVHVHDGVIDDAGKMGFVPIGDGRVNHRRALELLGAGGYDGFIRGEWIGWEPHEVHLPRELQRLRQIEKQIA